MQRPRATSRYSHVSIDSTSRLTSQHPRPPRAGECTAAQGAEAVEFFRRRSERAYRYSRILNGVATPVPSISGALPHLAAVSFSRTLTELLPKPTETALVNHVVKWHLFLEQGRRLNTQVKPLDVDLAVGAIACNDQKSRAGRHGAGNFDRPVGWAP